MDYDKFIAEVQDAAGIEDRAEAETAAKTTILTLGMRLEEGEAADLASQLPVPLKDELTESAGQMQKLSLDEFFDKVAALEGNDRAAAETHARAVVGVLSEAVSRGELSNVFSQLPPEYAELMGPKG